MPYRVLATDQYEESLNKIEITEQIRVEKIVSQIAEKGEQVGKPLRFRFFREKKFGGQRLYFLIYAEWYAILLVRISDKKQQPETIEWIIENLDELKRFVETKLKEERLI
jgi:mRNA-degrading endonuclease RelE of RelBE toxin-antitoxin system